MQPLKLTWTVVEMGEPAHPIHLDALVSYAMSRDEIRRGRAKPEMTERELSDSLVLPLERAKRVRAWCWKASVLIPDQVWATGMRLWTRKVDPVSITNEVRQGSVELGDRAYLQENHGAERSRATLKPYAGKIDTVRGELKQYYKFVPTRNVSALTAWCVGDEDALTHLLDPHTGYITHIGPRIRLGLGRVLSFSIVPDESAATRWQLRASPWAYDNAVEMPLAVHPPYWAPENQVKAWIDPALFG